MTKTNEDYIHPIYKLMDGDGWYFPEIDAGVEFWYDPEDGMTDIFAWHAGGDRSKGVQGYTQTVRFADGLSDSLKLLHQIILDKNYLDIACSYYPDIPFNEKAHARVVEHFLTPYGIVRKMENGKFIGWERQ